MKPGTETEKRMKRKRKGEDTLKIHEEKKGSKNGKKNTAETSMPRFQEKKVDYNSQK